MTTNKMFLCRTVFVLLAMLMLALPVAHAQDSAPPKVLEADYDDLEDLGIYRDKAEGLLATDMWENAAREDITALIKNIPAASRRPIAQELIFGALLGRGNDDFADKAHPRPGEDLLTLRLERLLEAGAYEQAFALYNMVEEEPYHPRLARVGVLAMFARGEMSLACLEVKTVIKRFEDETFWQNINAYCDVTLESADKDKALSVLKESDFKTLYKLASDKDYSFSYTPDSFGELDLTERLVLAGAKKLDITKTAFPPENLDKTPAADLQLLAMQDGLSLGDEINLAIEAAARGLKSKESLAKLYDDKIKFPADEKPPAYLTKPSNKGETILSLYYQAQEAEDNTARAKILLKALDISKTHNRAALLPFADMLSDYASEEASAEQILEVLYVLAVAGESTKGEWDDVASEYINTITAKEKPSASEKKQAYTMASALCIWEGNGCEVKTTLSTLEKLSPEKLDAAYLLTRNIIETLDENYQKEHNAIKVYEKQIYLTFNGNYVMPSMNVWHGIINASKQDSIGETVLLSIFALAEQAPYSLYPALADNVQDSLNRVGLTHIARKLALLATLGNVNK